LLRQAPHPIEPSSRLEAVEDCRPGQFNEMCRTLRILRGKRMVDCARLQAILLVLQWTPITGQFVK
jgi:hypothetical protein